MYFHVHNSERHSVDVDVGKTQVDSLVEVSKVGDEPHQPYSTLTTTVLVQRYIKEVGHILSVMPPPLCLSLDTHMPWHTHPYLHHMQPTAMLHHCCHRSSLTCHHHCHCLCAATAAAHLLPVTTTAAIYALPPLPLISCLSPPLLPSTHHHSHHLRISPSTLMCHGVCTPAPPPHTTPAQMPATILNESWYRLTMVEGGSSGELLLSGMLCVSAAGGLAVPREVGWDVAGGLHQKWRHRENRHRLMFAVNWASKCKCGHSQTESANNTEPSACTIHRSLASSGPSQSVPC